MIRKWKYQADFKLPKEQEEFSRYKKGCELLVPFCTLDRIFVSDQLFYCEKEGIKGILLKRTDFLRDSGMIMFSPDAF